MVMPKEQFSLRQVLSESGALAQTAKHPQHLQQAVFNLAAVINTVIDALEIKDIMIENQGEMIVMTTYMVDGEVKKRIMPTDDGPLVVPG